MPALACCVCEAEASKDGKDAKDAKDGKDKPKDTPLPPGTTSDITRNLSRRLEEGFKDKEYTQNYEEFQKGIRPIIEPIGKAAAQAKSIAVATANSRPVQSVVGGVKTTVEVAGKIVTTVRVLRLLRERMVGGGGLILFFDDWRSSEQLSTLSLCCA